MERPALPWCTCAVRPVLLLAWSLAVRALAAPVADEPFWQDVSEPVRLAPELEGAAFRRLVVDRENTVLVLTDRGVARVHGDVLAPDASYRPLAGKPVVDLAATPAGDVYWLLVDQWLTNARNGIPRGDVKPGRFRWIVPEDDGSVWLAGPGVQARVGPGGRLEENRFASPAPVRPFAGLPGRPWMAVGDRIRELDAAGVTAVATRGRRAWVGTHRGLKVLDLADDGTAAGDGTLDLRLPCADITALHAVSNGVWAGTTRGVFFRRDGPTPGPGRNGTLADGAPLTADHGIRYYAGRRWLRDDAVVDLAADHDGQLWVLTRAGLDRIGFHSTTLAAKAEWYHRKVRGRNLRYGFTAERRLRRPGDITSSELIDTDNDGGWTSYYLGGLAARYAVTRDETTRRQAWESFGALERTQSIHTNTGFPARTFERRGHKYSDPDRWRDAPDAGWEWKGHTSSDEICSQTFAHAVMWELVARDDVERARIAAGFVRIVDHILAHDLYLVDVDGKPTLWGRWHPDYVNWFPHSIVDRRLNSAEITASLQLAFAMTGDRKYRDAALRLFTRHGYLENILWPMSAVAYTPGYIHQGNDMGDEWNHSDDELAFFTYWVLVRFAFDAELRGKYLAAVRDHWEVERAERYPIWNFILAACGGTGFGAEEAVWTLRGTPLDTLTWTVTNSGRGDLTRLPKNFLRRESKELLPPGERLMARINTQPFILDHGDGGGIDLPGDEFLTGYWLGRYVGAIAPPARD